MMLQACGVPGPAAKKMHKLEKGFCGLAMFCSQSNSQQTLLSLLNHSILPGAAHAGGILDPRMEKIAVNVARETVNRTTKWKKTEGRDLRVLLTEHAGVENVEPADNGNAFTRDNGTWYSKVRISMHVIVFQFVISLLRAIYEGKAHGFNPNKRYEYEPEKFAFGLLWDAVTVFCLDTDHVALLCPNLKGWHTHLHTSFLKLAFSVIEAAVPEELSLIRPKYGESAPYAPDGRPWRLNLTKVCNEGLKASGMLLRTVSPCGPLTTMDMIQWYYTALLQQQHRNTAGNIHTYIHAYISSYACTYRGQRHIISTGHGGSSRGGGARK